MQRFSDARVFSFLCCTFLLHLQVTATNVDIARVAPTYHLYTVDEVEGVIGRL